MAKSKKTNREGRKDHEEKPQDIFSLRSLRYSFLRQIPLALPLGLMVYWLALVWWVFLDARVHGERAWVWATFVLMGNLAALFAYLLTRQPHPGGGKGIVPDPSPMPSE